MRNLEYYEYPLTSKTQTKLTFAIINMYLQQICFNRYSIINYNLLLIKKKKRICLNNFQQKINIIIIFVTFNT